MNTSSTRRKFLAGLGLGAASPFLTSIAGQLVGEAMAQPAAAKFKRFIIFSGANGLLERFTTCQARSERDFDLGPVYQPVAAYKDRMTLVHRFFVPFTKDLHGSRTSLTTIMPSPSPSAKPAPPGGVSIDRYIAKKIGVGDAFSSTSVGRGDPLSSDGPNQSFPLIYAPAPAFAKYFGGSLPTGGGTPGQSGGFAGDFVAKDKSILDLLRADAARLDAGLGAPERAKLEQYLESLRALERQITVRATASTSCQKPPVPKDTPAACSGQDGIAGCNTAIEQLVDITFLMHQCGLTHVSHIQFEGMGGPHIKYDWLGDPRNHHDDNHANDNAILQKIETWWFSMIGRLVDQLAKAPEGNGTMLDNSLIMLVNTGGGIHHRGFDRHPLILLGGRAGSAGRYLEYAEGKHCMSEAYTSIANALGVPTEKFGDPNFCPGPLAGLL